LEFLIRSLTGALYLLSKLPEQCKIGFLSFFRQPQLHTAQGSSGC